MCLGLYIRNLCIHVGQTQRPLMGLSRSTVSYPNFRHWTRALSVNDVQGQIVARAHWTIYCTGRGVLTKYFFSLHVLSF